MQSYIANKLPVYLGYSIAIWPPEKDLAAQFIMLKSMFNCHV